MTAKRPLWLNIFGMICLVLFGVGLYLGLVVSDPEQFQGELFRITYAHVSVAWVTFLAVIMTSVFGMLYLWRANPRDDAWAVASAEAALFYAGLTIVGGMTYSRPTIGVFWDWDAKLTLTALMFVLLVGYFVVRGLIDNPLRRGRVSAVVSIIVLASLPFNWMAAQWFRTIHPSRGIRLVVGGVSSTFAPSFQNILLFNVVVAALIFFYFVLERVRIGRLEHKLHDEQLEVPASGEVIRV
jgi:heme exporter protein C